MTRVFFRCVLAAIFAVGLAAFDPITDNSGIYVVVWDRGTIDLQNNLPNGATLSDGTTFRDSMDAAVARWNQVIGNVQMAVSHGSTGSYSLGNELNELALDSSIEGFDFGSSTLAVTISFTDGGNTRLESDIIFNDSWDWDSYRGNLRFDKEDVRRVAIHEVGHLLGLDHPDQANPPQSVDAIMNSRVSDVDDLRQDDIDGGQFLYGAPNSPPPNDNFAGAIEVTLSGSGEATVSGSNVQSTSEPGEPVLDLDFPGGRSVWWKWTAPAKRFMEVTTLGSRYDTIMGIFTGSSVSSLATVAINDDVDPGVVRTSEVTFLAEQGVTYYFMVDGWAGLEGGIVLNLRELETPAPSVSISQRRVIAPLGSDLTFDVTATDAIGGALSYTWRKNNAILAGEESASLTIHDVTNADVGAYTVEVAETGGNSGYVTAFVLPNYPSTSVTQWGGRDVSSGADQLPSDLSDIVSLAGGLLHGLALRADGTVVGWGGEHTSSRYNVDQEIPPAGLDGVVAIAASETHSLALREDGSVVAWGAEGINSPAQAPAGLNAIAIETDPTYGYALLVDGSIAVWRIEADQLIPGTVPRDVVAIDEQHTLHTDGRVRAWDRDFLEANALPAGLIGVDLMASSGRLVVGRTTSGEIKAAEFGQGVSVVVPEEATDIVNLTVTDEMVFAVRADGSALSWGERSFGGDFLAAMPTDLSNVVEIKTGEVAMALQVGPATLAPSVVGFPADLTVVEGNPLVLETRVSGHNPFQFEWKRDGVTVTNGVRARGAGTSRLVIDPVLPTDAGSYILTVSNAAGVVSSQTVEVTVQALGQFTTIPLSKVAVEGDTVEFVAEFTGTGSVNYQWYFNEQPLSGEDSPSLSLEGVGLEQAGRYAVRAFDDIGFKWAQAELNIAPQGGAVVMVDGNWAGVDYPAPSVPATAQPAAKIDIRSHGLALLANGEILNLRRSIDLNTDLPDELPAAVDVAVGTDFAAAVLHEGTLQVWGKNNRGQASPPEGLVNVIAVEAGHEYAVALMSDGTIAAWGNSSVVDLIPNNLTDVVEIALGVSHGLALHRDGTLTTWGTTATSPEEVVNASRLVTYQDAAALLSDGSVQGWSPMSVFDRLPAISFGGSERVLDLDMGLVGGVAIGDQGSTLQWNYQGIVIDDLPEDLANPARVFVGNFIGFIQSVSAPEIQSISSDVVAVSGEEVVLTVSWTSEVAPVFQWFLNGQPLVLGEGMTVEANGTLRIAGAAPSDSGDYTVVVSNPAGGSTSTTVSVQIGSPPSIVSGPTGQTLFEGAGFTLSVVASNDPLTYQWLFNGGEILGATSADYSVAEAQIEDSGAYSVRIENPTGQITSNPAEIVVLPKFSGLHELDLSSPSGDDQIVVANRLVTQSPFADLRWSVVLPSGWSFVEDTADAATSRPSQGDQDLLEWVWTGSGFSPPDFTYTLVPPVNASGRFEISAMFELSDAGQATAQTLQPDPLAIVLGLHSADIDGNMRFSLSELLRVIQLYNVRSGTTRTGRYGVDGDSEDGFTPDQRAVGEGDLPTQFHSADTNRNGQMSLSELLRVIELYNTRTGTTRTGAYRISGGTEDGFAPDN